MTEPVSKEKLLEQAKRCLEEGRVDRAIQEYQKIVAADPRDFRVKLRIAELYIRLKQVGDAVKVYQEVANAYADEGFYLKSVTVYKNILRLNPSLRDVNGKLADLYEKMGLNQDAVHQYQILVSVVEHKGDHKAVLDLRRRIVALDPANVTNRIRLAESYQLNGQDQACLQEYETLAEQLKDHGSTEQMVDLYEKILTRRSDHLELLQRLCRIYYEQKEYKKALRRIEASQAVAAKDPELSEMQAEMYFRLNQIETAKGKWRELMELYQSMGAVEQALTACERILTVAPEEAEDLRELVEAITPGAMEAVKQRAEAKRVALAKEESDREALETARQAAASQIASQDEAPKGPTRHPPAAASRIAEPIRASGPLTSAEAEMLRSRARASEGLVAMYEQMGLQEEAVEEAVKALEAYRRLLVAGIGGTEILERVRTLEGVVPSDAVPPSQKASSVVGPSTLPAGRRQSSVTSDAEKPKQAPQKTADPKSPTPGTKKRISFV